MEFLTPRVSFVGILNLTPDSFSDGGECSEPRAAVARAHQMIDQGATIIDVGAVSTRPGSKPISLEEEWMRLEPVLTSICKTLPVSVDTYRAKIAKRALDCGAVMINDITAASDEKMCEVVASYNAKIVLMYSTAQGAHEFIEPRDGVMDALLPFLKKRKQYAISKGLKGQQVVLDPGMGAFISQNPAASWEILRNASQLASLDSTVLIGISRKSFLRLQAEQSPRDRDYLSALAALELAFRLQGVNELMVRVHNVALHVSMFRAEGLIY